MNIALNLEVERHIVLITITYFVKLLKELTLDGTQLRGGENVIDVLKLTQKGSEWSQQLEDENTNC